MDSKLTTVAMTMAVGAVAGIALDTTLSRGQSGCVESKQDVFEEEFFKLRAHYELAGQGQVFRFADTLNKEQKQELYDNLKVVDPVMINKNFESIKASEGVAEQIDVFDGETVVKYDLTTAQQTAYYNHGMMMIAKGRVAAVLMAGGQGTRLGSDLPKGMYNIHLPSGKSLFQLQAEKIMRLKQLAGPGSSLPWYIQTSDATHHETVKFLEEHKFFGIDSKDVFCFQQGLLPAISLEGKIILSSPTSLAMSPNGNGGIHSAINLSGALEDMIKRGVEYIHVYGVDNLLIKIADPTFIGCCAMKEVEAANKVVFKDDPHEKIGVMAMRGGKFGIVEYSEISRTMAEMRDKNNKLVYSGGNIAQHVFSVKFMSEVACGAFLPLHIAKKAIPSAGDDGKTVVSTEINGIKMEMFVFDVFAYAKKLIAFAVKREEEFTAVKNKPGNKGDAVVGDSPDSARRDYSLYHTQLAINAGATVVVTDGVYDTFEISPLVTYEGEGLDTVAYGKTFTAPYHLEKK